MQIAASVAMRCRREECGEAVAAAELVQQRRQAEVAEAQQAALLSAGIGGVAAGGVGGGGDRWRGDGGSDDGGCGCAFGCGCGCGGGGGESAAAAAAAAGALPPACKSTCWLHRPPLFTVHTSVAGAGTVRSASVASAASIASAAAAASTDAGAASSRRTCCACSGRCCGVGGRGGAEDNAAAARREAGRLRTSRRPPVTHVAHVARGPVVVARAVLRGAERGARPLRRGVRMPRRSRGRHARAGGPPRRSVGRAGGAAIAAAREEDCEGCVGWLGRIGPVGGGSGAWRGGSGGGRRRDAGAGGGRCGAREARPRWSEERPAALPRPTSSAALLAPHIERCGAGAEEEHGGGAAVSGRRRWCHAARATEEAHEALDRWPPARRGTRGRHVALARLLGADMGATLAGAALAGGAAAKGPSEAARCDRHLAPCRDADGQHLALRRHAPPRMCAAYVRLDQLDRALPLEGIERHRRHRYPLQPLLPQLARRGARLLRRSARWRPRRRRSGRGPSRRRLGLDGAGPGRRRRHRHSHRHSHRLRLWLRLRLVLLLDVLRLAAARLDLRVGHELPTIGDLREERVHEAGVLVRRALLGPHVGQLEDTVEENLVRQDILPAAVVLPVLPHARDGLLLVVLGHHPAVDLLEDDQVLPLVDLFHTAAHLAAAPPPRLKREQHFLVMAQALPRRVGQCVEDAGGVKLLVADATVLRRLDHDGCLLPLLLPHALQEGAPVPACPASIEKPGEKRVGTNYRPDNAPLAGPSRLERGNYARVLVVQANATPETTQEDEGSDCGCIGRRRCGL
eukprot:scaffold61692_cov73-Phaeocystis_antarctica.AAC.4